MPLVPFEYYERLSKKEKRIYDASDAVATVPLRKLDGIRAASAALEAALAAEDRRTAAKAAQSLSDAICRDLEVAPARVKVLSRRPSDDESTLHGLYVREDDEVPVIRVWMRTAAQRRVVRFKTFLRTLLHEVLHHLDYELYGLEDSFHTQGFFRRESSLVSQVLGTSTRVKARVRDEEPTPEPARAPRQLGLFDTDRDV
jgi:hypothetical protein